MVTLMEAIEEYDGDLALRRVARSTRVKYRQHLHAFAEAVGKKRNPASVSTHEIKMHLARWQRDYEANEGRELSSATVRNRITLWDASTASFSTTPDSWTRTVSRFPIRWGRSLSTSRRSNAASTAGFAKTRTFGSWPER